MRGILICTLFFIAYWSFGQSLSGTVKSVEGEKLQNTNIIAHPKGNKKEVKFAITDQLGQYKLDLAKDTDYDITISFLGFESVSIAYSHADPFSNYDFVLFPKVDELDEILITYEYPPVIVKKDTVQYDILSFTDGSERKLKDQLEKLPGVEVTEEGLVKVQGKIVTQFLVEGNTFFGGGTRLGIENIPAEAVSSVEVIDHFTEVGHMKEVSGSEDLAMNIKLNEDKKQFVFGDIRAGYANNKYYETHASLFYYSPKINWSVIGNLNNFGSQLLSYDDLMRFEGFRSIYIRENNQKQLINLQSYINSNTDVVENKNQFLASDIRYSFNEKLDVKGLFIFNKNWIRSQTEQNIQYLQSEDITFENRNNNAKNRSNLFSGRISADFQQNNRTTYKYNLQLAATSNDGNSRIYSETDNLEKDLRTETDLDNFALSQLFEFHKTINTKNKATLAFTHFYNKETPQYNWLSDQMFLESYIPWNPSATYDLNEVKTVKQNHIQINAKHYWIALRRHHIYTTLGYNGIYTDLNSEYSYIDADNWNSLDDRGFGNQLEHRMNNPFVGVEHKFMYGKFTSTFGIFIHSYQLQNQYPMEKYKFSTTQIEPDLRLEYEFTDSKRLNFRYTLNNDYMGAEHYANRWQVQSFNALFKGNALLQNLQYQQAHLNFSNFNIYSETNVFASITYNKKNKNIREQVELIGIDQFYETVMSDRPDINWSFSGYGSKRFKKLEVSLNTSLGINKYTQITNAAEVNSKRNYQSIGGGIRTLFKEIPNVNFHYTKSFSQLESTFDNRTSSDLFRIRAEKKFFKQLLIKADYSWMNTRFDNEKTKTEQVNAFLEYELKDSSWTFIIRGNNLLDTGIKNQVDFSDFMIHNTNTLILPRTILFSIQYKL